MGDRYRTGHLAPRTGMYLCGGNCGTLIKMLEGEPLPWCMYCFSRVTWRPLTRSGMIPRVQAGRRRQAGGGGTGSE